VTLQADAITALAAGLAASVHCAAMCGPLVVAGCTRGAALDRGATAGYFGARVLGYAAVGAVMGHLGQSALAVLPVSVVQSVALGVVAAGAAIRGIGMLRRPRTSPLVALRRAPARPLSRGSAVAAAVAALLPRRGAPLGALTALLPCGMLVSAWLLAASTARPLSGSMVMLLFALASSVGLLGPLLARQLAARALAHMPRWVFGVAWCALAVFVALRPMIAISRCCAG